VAVGDRLLVAEKSWSDKVAVVVNVGTVRVVSGVSDIEDDKLTVAVSWDADTLKYALLREGPGVVDAVGTLTLSEPAVCDAVSVAVVSSLMDAVGRERETDTLLDTVCSSVGVVDGVRAETLRVRAADSVMCCETLELAALPDTVTEADMDSRVTVTNADCVSALLNVGVGRVAVAVTSCVSVTVGVKPEAEGVSRGVKVRPW
jgi:hypothetical protein